MLNKRKMENTNKSKYPVKYPRYTREENKAIKYTDELVEKIKELHKIGNGYRKIVKILAEEGIKVSQSGVRYYLISEEKRKAFNKEKTKYNKKRTKEQIKKYNEDRKVRKKEKLREYYSINKKEYIKQEEVKRRRKEYRHYYHNARKYKKRYSTFVRKIILGI